MTHVNTTQPVCADPLDVVSAVDLVLLANGDDVMTRSTLQAIVYFASKRIPNSKIDFAPKHFGPYSVWVTSILADMYSLGEAYEFPKPMNGFHIYSYGLTPPGIKQAERSRKRHPESTYDTIREIIDICRNSYQLDSTKLVYATKVHYVLTSDENYDLPSLATNDAICRAAGGFGWDMTVDNAKTGFDLLGRLGIDPREDA